MQTFLPYADFARSAAVLDTKRLGKQRIEAWQLLCALLGVDGTLQPARKPHGYRNHPAGLMWKGCELRLWTYLLLCMEEWRGRGYSNAVMDVNVERMLQSGLTNQFGRAWPTWFGMPRFHTAHRSNLLRKAPAHYRRFWPKLTDALPYYWPTHHPVPR